MQFISEKCLRSPMILIISGFIQVTVMLFITILWKQKGKTFLRSVSIGSNLSEEVYVR